MGRLRRVARRITQGWVDANVRNAVVLTGDVHRKWANDVKVDYKDPASAVVGTELVSTSITSTGSGSGSTTDPVMDWNPHRKCYKDNLNTRITKDAITADFRVLGYVTTLGSPVRTKASFAILEGCRGFSSGGSAVAASPAVATPKPCAGFRRRALLGTVPPVQQTETPPPHRLTGGTEQSVIREMARRPFAPYPTTTAALSWSRRGLWKSTKRYQSGFSRE